MNIAKVIETGNILDSLPPEPKPKPAGPEPKLIEFAERHRHNVLGVYRATDTTEGYYIMTRHHGHDDALESAIDALSDRLSTQKNPCEVMHCPPGDHYDFLGQQIWPPEE